MRTIPSMAPRSGTGNPAPDDVDSARRLIFDWCKWRLDYKQGTPAGFGPSLRLRFLRVLRVSAVNLALLVAISFITGCQTAHHADASGQSVENEIATLDDQTISAYFKGDTATMRRLEADDFIVIGDEGKAFTTEGRYEHIDRDVKEGKWFPGGAVRTKETRSIRVYGLTAIIYGIDLVKTDNTQYRLAFSGVWMKRNGRWRFVHLHFHTLKGPP